MMPKTCESGRRGGFGPDFGCKLLRRGNPERSGRFYHNLKNPDDMMPVMFGMNSRLVKEDGKVQEKVWRSGGLYGQAIDKIIYWLDKALSVAEDAQQK